jgi:hypothetical protein
MKVSDAIAQLQAMPADADFCIEIGEEFHDFEIEWRTKGENYPNGAHLVVIVPPEMSAAEKAADELLAAAQAVLAGLNARIEAAVAAKAPMPVFNGIADLHDAIGKATGAAS